MATPKNPNSIATKAGVISTARSTLCGKTANPYGIVTLFLSPASSSISLSFIRTLALSSALSECNVRSSFWLAFRSQYQKSRSSSRV
ncbi:MAG: hypothetical protein WAU01_09695 [Saprospiraceae bacterium]